jgi:hypothetical protein
MAKAYIRERDDLRAVLTAIVLLALAAFIALWVHPDQHGQATWFFALLPGAYAAPAFLDIEWKLFHRAGPEVMWTTVMLFSLVWYFVVGYAVVKAYRFVKSRTEDRITLHRM